MNGHRGLGRIMSAVGSRVLPGSATVMGSAAVGGAIVVVRSAIRRRWGRCVVAGWVGHAAGAVPLGPAAQPSTSFLSGSFS